MHAPRRLLVLALALAAAASTSVTVSGDAPLRVLQHAPGNSGGGHSPTPPTQAPTPSDHPKPSSPAPSLNPTPSSPVPPTSPPPTTQTPKPSEQQRSDAPKSSAPPTETPKPTTQAPTSTPTQKPTDKPTEAPVGTPTPTSTPTPTTIKPNDTPVRSPSTPAPTPTQTPTSTPTQKPTDKPVEAPAGTPTPTTVKPNDTPARTPLTPAPTPTPTQKPTTEQTLAPSVPPTATTRSPSATDQPTTVAPGAPISSPTQAPHTTPTPTTKPPEASARPSAPETSTKAPSTETTRPAARDPASPSPITLVPMTTKTPDATTKSPEATTKKPDARAPGTSPVPTPTPKQDPKSPSPRPSESTHKTPETTPRAPTPTTKVPAPSSDPGSPPPPPASLTQTPVTRAPSAPPQGPSGGNSTTRPGGSPGATPTRVPSSPKPPAAFTDVPSPSPVTRTPPNAFSVSPSPTARTPRPVSFNDSTFQSNKNTTVATVRPANAVDDQATKKDIITFNASMSPSPSTVDKFAIVETSKPPVAPQVFDVGTGSDRSEKTPKPEKYVRGKVDIVIGREDVVISDKDSSSGAPTSKNGTSAGTEYRNVIGGRMRADPVNANQMSAATADFHDMMRYSGMAFAGVSVALLLFFQFLSLDPALLPTWESNRAWAPNTWEFVLYIGYLQQLASTSQLSLIKAPYFMWDFTDAYSWTNFLMQTGYAGSKSMASDADGIASKPRRLTTILIGGVVAYADRLGIKEQSILVQTMIGVAVLAALVVVAFFLATIFAKRRAEHYGDTRSTDIMIEESTRVHKLRNVSARILGMGVVLWFTALYPLSAFASFEITMQVTSDDISTGPLVLAIFALLIVCCVSLAIIMRVVWSKDNKELQDIHTRAIWGPLTAHCHYGMRLFFFFAALAQIVSGIMVGSTDAEPGQVLGSIAVLVVYLVLVFVLKPFTSRLATAMTFVVGVVKIVNTGLSLAFLYSNNHLSPPARRSCAEALIGINTIVIVVWFVRHIGMFLAYLRVYATSSGDSDHEKWTSPSQTVGIEPVPTEHMLPTYPPSRQGYGHGNGGDATPTDVRAMKQSVASMDSYYDSQPMRAHDLAALGEQVSTPEMKRRGVTVVM